MTEMIQRLENDRRLNQRKAMVYYVLESLRDTVRLRGIAPNTPVDDVYIDMTEESARVVAPLVEAVQILEEIIFASGGCQGHRECAHSMEPWQRARALLQGKWDADNSFGEQRWP